MSTQSVVVRLTAVVLIGVGVSYVLALAGEPQSVWLWRDVLNVIQ